MNELDRRTFVTGTASLLGAGGGMNLAPTLLAEEPTPRGRSGLPTIPFGAVYFRKSNPPKSDWQRDHAQAAQDGMNCFRHWFIWSAIEVAPGQYDWSDYDQQMDLAAKYGIKAIVAELLNMAPQWAFRRYPHAKVEERDGRLRESEYTIACAVGGYPGLCLDNEDVRERAAAFVRALVMRYKDHPAMGGYDVMNELNHNGDAGGCWCDASAEKFRQWLKSKYGNLKSLGEAWYQYGYESWEDVQIPRTNQPYPDSMDWALFRVDNATRLFRWRVELIRELDDKNPITCHAIPMGSIKSLGPDTYPVFQAGKLVDIYGYSGGCNHEEWTKLRWQHWCKMDMTRSACGDKPFWAAEVPAGASWRMKNREMDEGRHVTPEDLRLYTLTNFAGGARGLFSPRWRPLLDGPVAGSFGFYNMDGTPTDRSRAAAELSRWANDSRQTALWNAKPVAGDIGILVVPESQIHCYTAHDSTEYYYKSISGAYQAFLFNNVQPDFVPIDAIGPQHELLYLPFPVMLSEETAMKLTAWVDAGGKLISEGCPAYHGDRGRIGTSQPNYGLDRVFGVKQDYIQFTPDLLEDVQWTINGDVKVPGGIFLQWYQPTTGNVVGHFDDGRIAAVDNRFGKGATRLVGTFPGYGYGRKTSAESGVFFRDLISWGGKQPHVRCKDDRLICRIHQSDNHRFLWVVNSTRKTLSAQLTLSDEHPQIRSTRSLLNGTVKQVSQRTLAITAPARDVVVVEC